MKKSVIMFLFALFTANLVAQDDCHHHDKKAIERCIVTGYINGIFNDLSADAIRGSWYPGCEICVYLPQKDTCIKHPVSAFIKLAESRPERAPFPKVTHRFKEIVVAGRAAVAVVEVFAEGKPLYTDFMNLYKFEKGWMIVTKTFADMSLAGPGKE
ncbi:MAG: nuclear transport factor 2 family protein [Bacteroidales bacterium]|nr:nuclear transport factor 2 family protein [Bacteroidales bacterium]MDD3664008.1 nuclear transport factor 2 family protein [Bacteroidales bacterium]